MRSIAGLLVATFWLAFLVSRIVAFCGGLFGFYILVRFWGHIA